MQIDQQQLDAQTDQLRRCARNAARSPMKGVRTAALALTLGAGSLSGCTALEQGVALGGSVGGTVGNLAANSTEGTLIGVAVGALAGGVISYDLQQDLEEAAEDTPITVRRISNAHLEVSVPGGVLFATDESTLSPELKGSLAEVTRVLDHGDKHLVILEGHTRHDIKHEHNHWLGMERAESVESFIQQVAHHQQLDSGKAVAISRGETDPVSDDCAQNRRVKIEILTGNDARQYLEAAKQEKTAMAGPGM